MKRKSRIPNAVLSRRLLWIDVNHDGGSQPDELHSLHRIGRVFDQPSLLLQLALQVTLFTTR